MLLEGDCGFVCVVCIGFEKYVYLMEERVCEIYFDDIVWK